jgi:hypothetical protein
MRDNILSLCPVIRTVRTLEHFRHYHEDGSRCHTPHDLCPRKHSAILVDRDVSENLVMTAGLNELLDGVFNEAPAAFTWFLGLVDNAGFSAYAAGDTMASHAGWTELTAYTGNRKAWTKNAGANAGAMSNSSSKGSYAINDTKTVRGAFLCVPETGTSGVLYGAGDFSGTRAVVSGDTLTLQVDLSAAAA